MKRPEQAERKYGNKPTELDGIKFASKREARRYAELRLLEKAADQEIRMGHALHGPHRDDFRLILGEDRKDEFFSQGEYRISLLALKLAINLVMTRRMGFHPVLILDDLFSELDGTVRSNLRAYLFEIENQIFITSTDHGEAKGFPDARVMEIREGRVIQE